MSDLPSNAAPQIQPRRAYEASAIPGLENCNRLEILFPMNEFDLQKPVTHRIETWPDDPRVQIERELADWSKRHPGVRARAITTAVVNGACIVVLHWEPKT